MLDKQVLLDPAARRASAPLVPFACSWTDDGDDAASVRLVGELDIFTSPQLERALADAQQQAHLVVADLRDVTFVDSSAVHALVHASARAELGGDRLVVLRGPMAVDRIFCLSRACDGVEVMDVDAAEPLVMVSLRLAADERGWRSADVSDRLRRTG